MNNDGLVCLWKQQTPDDTMQSVCGEHIFPVYQLDGYINGEHIFPVYQLDEYINNAVDKNRAVYSLTTYREENKIKLLDLFSIGVVHLKQKGIGISSQVFF